MVIIAIIIKGSTRFALSVIRYKWSGFKIEEIKEGED